MDTITIIFMITTFIHGLGAGICFDVAFVKLPTRHRIGTIAYANFARGNDLGNGIIVYPIVAVSGALFLFGSTIIAFNRGMSSAILYPLYVATLSTIFAFIGTAKAAPNMLSLKNTPNEEYVLNKKLNMFSRWHTFRSTFQILSFLALLLTLVNLRFR